MSILANRMKGVAPSSQVTNLLTANFNVPSRGKKTVVGTVAQLKFSSSSTVSANYVGFGLYSGSPYIQLLTPGSGYNHVTKLATDMNSILWQREVLDTNSHSGYTNCLAVDNSGNANIFAGGYIHSLSNADGSFRNTKTTPGPWYSSNALLATTTSNECIYNGWGVSGSGTAIIARFNSSSGSNTWIQQVSSGEGPPFNQGMGIAESADGTAITYGVRVQGTTQDSWQLRRVNFSNGGQIWQYKYYDSAYQSWQPFTMVEGGSLIVTGLAYRNLVAVNTSNGDISWQRKYDSSSGDIWEVTYNSGTGYFYAIDKVGNLFVLNSSGTEIYKRSITLSGGLTFQSRGVRVDSTWIYIMGVAGNSAYVVKMPRDGTGVDADATFSNGVTITYSESTLTQGTPSHAKFSSSMSIGTPSSGSTTSTSVQTATNFTTSTVGL